MLNIEWNVTAACGGEGEDDTKGGSGGEEKQKEKVGSGIGWFFLV